MSSFPLPTPTLGLKLDSTCRRTRLARGPRLDHRLWQWISPLHITDAIRSSRFRGMTHYAAAQRCLP